MKNKLNIPANQWISQNFQLTYFIDLFGVSVLLISKNSSPSSSDGKESAFNAGDWSLIPGLGRSPGEGNGNPLHYSFFFNSFIFKLKDNCFTEFCWFLPNMNKKYGTLHEFACHPCAGPSYSDLKFMVWNNYFYINCLRGMCSHSI